MSSCTTNTEQGTTSSFRGSLGALQVPVQALEAVAARRSPLRRAC